MQHISKSMHLLVYIIYLFIFSCSKEDDTLLLTCIAVTTLTDLEHADVFRLESI